MYVEEELSSYAFCIYINVLAIGLIEHSIISSILFCGYTDSL